MRSRTRQSPPVGQIGARVPTTVGPSPPEANVFQKLQEAADQSPVVQHLSQLTARPPNGNAPNAGTETVQLVADLSIGGQLVDLKSERMKNHVRVLEQATGGFEGEVWFNSTPEATNWFTGTDREGLGVWGGRWMNFKQKGPIVFGEQHNAIRQKFIEKLNIRHYVVEGAHEFSLEGVATKDLPKGTEAQAVYSGAGAGGGKALENYWVRNALAMEFFWSTLERQLLAMDVDDPRLTAVPYELPKHLHNGWVAEMRGYLDSIAETKSKSGQQSGFAERANLALEAGQYHLSMARELGLDGLLDLLSQGKHIDNLGPEIKRIDALGGGGAIATIAMHLGELRKIAVQLGEINFQANASPEALAADELTKDSTDRYEKWNGRRELFMLKNLEEALNQNPKPYLITMGSAHARNQETAINALLSKHGGRLIVGDIMDLADYGAIPMRTIKADIEAWAETLAQIYGWGQSGKDDYAASNEAAFEGKKRVHEGLKPEPTPSYFL